MKIFCIGRNKTGTTSLEHEMKELGFSVGNQTKGERLLKEWIKGDYRDIIELAKTADFFQDIPFSYPETYKHLDKEFPNSKFILTIRKSGQEWYNSLTTFHSKMFNKKNYPKPPSVEQLKNVNIHWKGWIYEAIKNLYKTNDNDIYNKEILINHYNKHNTDIINYFKDRPNDLLILDLSKEGSYDDMCRFLNVKPNKFNFVKLNSSKI